MFPIGNIRMTVEEIVSSFVGFGLPRSAPGRLAQRRSAWLSSSRTRRAHGAPGQVSLFSASLAGMQVTLPSAHLEVNVTEAIGLVGMKRSSGHYEVDQHGEMRFALPPSRSLTPPALGLAPQSGRSLQSSAVSPRSSASCQSGGGAVRLSAYSEAQRLGVPCGCVRRDVAGALTLA